MHDSALNEGHGNGWDEDESMFQDPEKIEYGTLLLRDDHLSYWNGVCWELLVPADGNHLNEEEVEFTNELMSYTRDELLQKPKDVLIDFMLKEVFNNTLNEEMFATKLEKWENLGITTDQVETLLDVIEDSTAKYQAIQDMFSGMKSDYLQGKGWKMVAVSPDALKMLNALSEDGRYAWKIIQDNETSYLYLDS